VRVIISRSLWMWNGCFLCCECGCIAEYKIPFEVCNGKAKNPDR
jgi:hypothetical protein